MEQLGRRSMTAALKTVELPAEAVALIKEGTPKPQTLRKEAVIEAEPESRDESKTRPRVAPNRKDLRSQSVPQQDDSPRAFVSFRLPALVADALLRASMDRRLNRERPWAQQDLVSAALSVWLKKEGYLPE